MSCRCQRFAMGFGNTLMTLKPCLFRLIPLFLIMYNCLVTRSNSELVDTVSKLRSTIANLQQRETDTLRQVRQSVEVAEQAQVEREQVCLLY